MYYAVLLAVATAGLVLLLVTGHLRPANVLGFCIAFSNAYGLVAGALVGSGLSVQIRGLRGEPHVPPHLGSPLLPAAACLDQTCSQCNFSAAIFLLGFGLVAVPKQLWLSADLHGEQRRVCHQAGLQVWLSTWCTALLLT